MELLVVTLAYTTASKDVELLPHIRLIAETVRNTNGILTTQFYRGKGREPYYAILTTWGDEESWQRLQERYNPRQLILSAGTNLLTSSPQQWRMQYLWGYSRPTINPTTAAFHMVTIRHDQADSVQRNWVEGLRRQAVQSSLTFAFLARGMRDTTPLTKGAKGFNDVDNSTTPQGVTFLNLLSWSSESEREEFYADPNYQALSRFVSKMGVVKTLSLEPL